MTTTPQAATWSSTGSWRSKRPDIRAALPVYRDIAYDIGVFRGFGDKSQTYSVEADNAELRHYLARLARRSRCFSRSLDALRAAVRLFVFLWNHRQLHKQRFPAYPAHLIEFLPMRS